MPAWKPGECHVARRRPAKSMPAASSAWPPCMQQVDRRSWSTARLAPAGRAATAAECRMIGAALRTLELGDVPVATPTGPPGGRSGLLLESVGLPSCRPASCQIGDPPRVAGSTRRSWASATRPSFLMPFKKPQPACRPAPRAAGVSDRAPLHDRHSPGWAAWSMASASPSTIWASLGGEHAAGACAAEGQPAQEAAASSERLDVGVRAINGMLTARQRPARGPDGRQRRGQERAARPDHPPDRGRRGGGGPDRRARPRSARVYRTSRWGRTACAKPWWSWRRPTNRR